ncbi:hypothetical protein ACLOJK_015826 [Asimina triloba]
MVPEAFVFVYSGQLIRKLADVKYGKHHMTTVEIVYNVLSFIVTIIAIVAFTVYAKRALHSLENMEGNTVEEDAIHHRVEMESLPLERPGENSSLPS